MSLLISQKMRFVLYNVCQNNVVYEFKEPNDLT